MVDLQTYVWCYPGTSRAIIADDLGVTCKYPAVIRGYQPFSITLYHKVAPQGETINMRVGFGFGNGFSLGEDCRNGYIVFDGCFVLMRQRNL